MNGNSESVTKWLGLGSPVVFVAITSLAVGLLTFHPSYPNLFPEVPSLWWFNQGIDLSKLIDKYLDFDGMWYRPTQTWTYFQIYAQIFDWHSPATFRWLTIGFHAFASVSVVIFTRMLFPTRKFTQVFAGIYFATSPNLYFLLVEAASHDYPYIIASLWSLILLLSVLDSPNSNLRWKLTGSFFLYLFALTNREIVITLPVLVFLLPVLFRRKFRTLFENHRMATLTFLVVHLIFFFAYYFLHIAQLPTVDSGYRTVFHVDIFIGNCTNFILWLVRIFINAGTPAFDLPPSTPGLIFGIFLLIIIAPTLINYFHAKTYKHNSNLLFALIATSLFCAIPAVAGGFGWHINLAIACFAPVVGYCVERVGSYALLERASYCPLMLFVFIAIGYVDLKTQIESLSIQHGAHIISAINAPPSIDIDDDSALIFYEIGEKPKWAFGVGKLFRFLYEDLSITETAYPSIYSVTDAEADFFLSHSNRYYFSFNSHTNRWEDRTKWAVRILQGRNP